MGDENMSNYEEDTSVLFVSAQKKKKAEEEARLKAEQEQAEREAREAEIRRQEAEVASRKNKAERLKKNLDIKEQERSQHKTKNMLMPVFIGVGLAVAIVIVAFIAMIASPSPKKAYEELAEFNAEYTAADAGYKLKVMYPDTVFTEVNEEASDDELDITFAGDGDAPEMEVIAAKTKFDKVTKNIAWNEINDKLRAVSKKHLHGAEIVEEQISDPLGNDYGDYKYQCTYTLDGRSGAYSGWCTLDSDGNVVVEAVDCKAGANDLESAVRLRNQFSDINAKDKIQMPGTAKSVSTDSNDILFIEEINAGLPVPENMFTEVDSFEANGGKWKEYTDENGAIVLAGVGLYSDRASYTPIDQSSLPALYAIFRDSVDQCLDGKVKYADRTFVSEKTAAVSDVDYMSYYDLKVSGRLYNESDYVSLVATDENVYTFIVYLLAPNNLRSYYDTIFRNMFKGSEGQ